MNERVVPSAPARGVFEQLAMVPSPGTIGWIVQGYPDERIDLQLSYGEVLHWGDARSRGKVPDQPVLFLQSRPGDSRWVGWGRVVEPDERWRVLGVTVRCEEVARPGLAVIAPGSVPSPRSGEPAQPPSHDWEFRELGHALGLETHRDRTPYLDTDARDLRLGAHDLRFLLGLQPALGRFGRSQR